MVWHAATSVLSSFIFFQDTDKPQHWNILKKKTLKNPANLFKDNLNKTKNNMKSQIKKKKNGGIVELLMPTFFQKKLLRGQKLSWTKKLWGGCSKLED